MQQYSLKEKGMDRLAEPQFKSVLGQSKEAPEFPGTPWFSSRTISRNKCARCSIQLSSRFLFATVAQQSCTTQSG